MVSASPASDASASPLARGLRLGRIFGIRIQIHWSLIFIFLLVLLDLGVAVFPSWHPSWTPAVTWLTAMGAAVLFFASVLAHELSHSVVARSQGMRVDRITLFLFGGISEIKDEPPSPKSEFLMAVVGPLTSLGIGVLAILVGTWGSSIGPFEAVEGLGNALRSMGPVRTLLLWLGPINILLGLFNLIPGFPLDGGRVFRSALWWITGEVMKATRWAAAVGQFFGWLLIFIGFLNLFSGASVQGLWLVLIGWFLSNAAGMSYQQMFLSQTLRNVRVTEMMRQVTALDPDLVVQSLVDDHLMKGEQMAYPVLVGKSLVGLVRLNDVRKIPREKWPWLRVSDIMTPVEKLTTVPSTIPASRAAEILAQQGGIELPVMDRDEFLGLIEQQDVLRWITLHPPATATNR